MAMKKAFRVISPLRQGAGKSFRSLPVQGWRWRWLQTLSWNFDRVLRVSILEAIYRRKGRPRGCPRRPHHPPGAGQAGPRGQVVWRPSGSSPSHILASDDFRKIGTLAFVLSNSENIHFLTFLEPKIAENRQLALWLLLIGQSKKSYEKYSKVWTKHKKVDKTKHGTSKIIDTFAMFQISR